jgi:hypothetical protein
MTQSDLDYLLQLTDNLLAKIKASATGGTL